MRVTEQGIADGGYGIRVGPKDDTLGTTSVFRFSPPPSSDQVDLAASDSRKDSRFLDVTSQSHYFVVGPLMLWILAYCYLKSRNLLPWKLGQIGRGEAIPQSDVARLVRAKPKKVEVHVEVLGEKEGLLKINTKGLSSVAELGERLAEDMVTQLGIEDVFKLYYVDSGM